MLTSSAQPVRAMLALFTILGLCAVVCGTGAAQVPVGVPINHGHADAHDAHDAHDADDYTPAPLNFSSPAPHLFASAYGLLQQLSNTVFPNGHSLVAGSIPAYTLLHHGLRRAENDDDDDDDDNDELSPASPEWLAFDAEMAYGIMGGTRGSWLLTYQTTRRVRVLYADGMSAALMGLGQLDTQMLLLYGNVTGPAAGGDGGERWSGLAPEYDRARGLCGWLAAAGLGGRGWGIEGVVRMNAGFELIWCDFQSDSLRLVSRLDVTVRGQKSQKDDKVDGVDRVDKDDSKADNVDRVDRKAAEQDIPPPPLPPAPTRTDAVANPSNPPAPPNWRRPDDADADPEPFVDAQGWAWFESAAWHYGASRAGPGAGETRVRVDPPCAVLSFYGRRFAGGPLAHARAADERARLNLTRDGAWAGRDRVAADDNDDDDNAAALRQLARRRRLHHLGDASADEAAQMRLRAEAVLRRVVAGDNGTAAAAAAAAAAATCSGADWPLILAEIVQRTARHLKTLEALLRRGPRSPPANATAAAADRAWLRQVRAESHVFLMPYLAYPGSRAEAASASSSPWRRGSARFNATLARCRYRYTRLLVDSERAAPLAEEEADLRWAVEETQGALCAGLVDIGFGVEGAVADEAAVEDLAALRARWLARLAELIAWLGWEPEFLGCAEVCAWHERCFVPMWPLASRRFGRGPPGGGHYGGGGGGYGRYGRPYGPPPWDRHGNGTGPSRPPGFGRGNGSVPGFPRSPAMMGDETDLWAPKCVEAWYMGG